jgi:probable rRNA maturation factor
VAITIEISDTQGSMAVERDALVQLALRALAREKRSRASITVALVDDATIHALNRRHLGHDWPTDVISFPLSEPEDPVLCGELVISTERALAQAHGTGTHPRDELALYLVHGLLHLCGYDDTSAASASAMRRREIELLTAAGFSNPYASRGPHRRASGRRHRPAGSQAKDPR